MISFLAGGCGFGPWRLPANASGGDGQLMRVQSSLLRAAQCSNEANDGSENAPDEGPDGFISR